MSTTSRAPRVPVRHEAKLPLAGLLALFTAGFLGIINETVPAGLLPAMSESLGLSEAVAGQTVTVYALATAFTAIPLNAALKNRDRRLVLVSALVIFALANAVVALVSRRRAAISHCWTSCAGPGCGRGFGFGGSATLFVVAGIRAAGTDAVQSLIVTVFNLSIAAGGVIGGFLISGLGVLSVPWIAAGIMIPTIIATVAGRRQAFPAWTKNT